MCEHGSEAELQHRFPTWAALPYLTSYHGRSDVRTTIERHDADYFNNSDSSGYESEYEFEN